MSGDGGELDESVDRVGKFLEHWLQQHLSNTAYHPSC
jgi:hypothetical protein